MRRVRQLPQVTAVTFIGGQGRAKPTLTLSR